MTYRAAVGLASSALTAYGSERWGTHYDLYVTAHDPGDVDRDGEPATTDCNDEDYGAFAAPGFVEGLRVNAEGTVWTWTSLADTAGSGTRYELVRGELGELLASGSFAGADCLAQELATASYEDASPAPEAGRGTYTLVRGVNVCGAGSYGAAGHARSELDGVCP